MKRILILLALGTTAFAQSTIAPAQPFAWGVNMGWLNARPDAAFGVRTADTACSGYAWSANVGWITLGGTPANGWQYANTAGDWGVNVQPDGTLRGFAWGANIGWVNFEAAGNPRIDLASGAFAGFAWSANVGWLNLSGVASSTLAIADTDGDGISDAWELKNAGNLATLSHSSDADGDGVSDFDEYLADTASLDAADYLHIMGYEMAHPGGVPTQSLQFASQPSRLYRIETRLSLTTGVWEDAGLGLFPGQPGSTLIDLGSPVDAQRFYRITAQRPLVP